jgi:hypothetical protein
MSDGSGGSLPPTKRTAAADVYLSLKEGSLEHGGCFTAARVRDLFFFDSDSFIYHGTAGIQSSVNILAMQNGAECHPSTLLPSQTCLARVWATWLQDLLAYTREKAWKTVHNSLIISLMIGETRERYSSPISQSFTNSWLSVSTCKFWIPRLPAGHTFATGYGFHRQCVSHRDATLLCRLGRCWLDIGWQLQSHLGQCQNKKPHQYCT